VTEKGAVSLFYLHLTADIQALLQQTGFNTGRSRRNESKYIAIEEDSQE
jgi:hypothetical protein